MALPTRDELHEEVDRLFAEAFPEAPARLDPDDASHSAWIDEWLSIRDTTVNDWVDEIFARNFPDAGRLDPDNPEHAQLIEYWTDIRDQIRDGVPGRYNWDADVGIDVLTVVSVDHDPAGGWLVMFDRDVTVDQVTGFVWSGGTPDGVVVTARTARQVHLRGLSIEAVQTMHPDVADRIEPSVLTADPPADGPTGSTGHTPDADVDVAMEQATEERVAEWTKHALEGTHALASTAEVTEFLAEATAHLVGHASKAAVVARAAGSVARVLGPIGHVVMLITIGWEVIDAFKSERRSSVKQGFAYGVMWEALGEPDHLPTFEPGITYSAEEHREAFEEGIAQGRAKAQDPKVRNQVILAVASLGLSSGYGEFYAANEVLSQLWRAVREPSPGMSDTDTIRWPVPYDRNPLVVVP